MSDCKDCLTMIGVQLSVEPKLSYKLFTEFDQGIHLERFELPGSTSRDTWDLHIWPATDWIDRKNLIPVNEPRWMSYVFLRSGKLGGIEDFFLFRRLSSEQFQSEQPVKEEPLDSAAVFLLTHIRPWPSVVARCTAQADYWVIDQPRWFREGRRRPDAYMRKACALSICGIMYPCAEADDDFAR